MNINGHRQFSKHFFLFIFVWLKIKIFGSNSFAPNCFATTNAVNSYKFSLSLVLYLQNCTVFGAILQKIAEYLVQFEKMNSAIIQTLANWNPWWESGAVSPELKGVRRSYTDELLALAEERQVKIVTGVRRSGKSTLFYQVIDWLLQRE
jgi:late competence protein required for DNA uptake (superfamily II DNA/RNA helicase)